MTLQSRHTRATATVVRIADGAQLPYRRKRLAPRSHSVIVFVAVLCVCLVVVAVLHGLFIAGYSHGPLPRLIHSAKGSHYFLTEYAYPISSNSSVKPPIVVPSLSSPIKTSTNSSDEGLSRVAIFMVVNDDDSFGSIMFRKRTLHSTFRFLHELMYPPNLLSLAILVSNDNLADRLRTLIASTPQNSAFFSRATVIHTTRTLPTTISRDARKDFSIQGMRRSFLAQLRNLLISLALGDSEGVLWVDSDVAAIPPDTLLRMASSGKDILTPLSYKMGSSQQDYDKNAWRGPRLKPTKEQLAAGTFVPNSIESESCFVSHFANGPDDFVELDSVGGTVLYVRSDVHRYGAVFPATYMIGADWEQRNGYDGIETEGLCYVAKALGFKCWAMPHIATFHSSS